MQLAVHKNAQNDLIKGEIAETLYAALEGVFKDCINVDGTLASAIQSAPEGTLKLHVRINLANYMKARKKEHLSLHLRLHLQFYLRVKLRSHLSCACIALVGALINAQKCTKIVHLTVDVMLH